MPIIPFSEIKYSSQFGKILRWWLKWIPDQAVLPVLQGPLRGARWISGAQTHGMWLGSYEIHMQKALASNLKQGAVFYDIGANVGFYSLLAAKLVGISGKVYAFEPLPSNLVLLEKHIRLNHFENIFVVDSALSNFSGHSFFSSINSSIGHLDRQSGFRVNVTTLDDYLYTTSSPPPDVIKVDIEGAEVEMLEGSLDCIARYRPLMFMAIHSPQLMTEVEMICTIIGYSMADLIGGVIHPGNYLSEVQLIPS